MGENIMTDLLFIIALSFVLWLTPDIKAHEDKMNKNVAELQATMSYIWSEGEAVTKKLKRCEKRRKR